MKNYLMWRKTRLELEFMSLQRKGVKKYVCDKIKNYVEDEDGSGVIEMVLILVVLIGFVIVFRDKIKALLDNVYSKINTQANSLYGTP